MPVYTFKCESCKVEVEQQFSVYTNATVWCQPCQIPMEKQFTAPAVHFKGKGWGSDKQCDARHITNDTPKGYAQMKNKLDKLGMLNRLARLKGSALRRAALGRAIVILALAMTHSVAGSQALQTKAIDEKPFNVYNKMNVKLYLHNQINDWDEFTCAIELAQRESSWRYDAVNSTTGAYGLFQHMSDYAKEWDAFKQIDKHVEYINTRYSGSWCKALQHLVRNGWH